MEREKALELLEEFTKNQNLIKHALAIEAAMRFYSKIYNEDENIWSITGLLHDFDYEINPNAPDHPIKGAEILKQRGYSEEIIQAILGHADYTGVARKTNMAKTLFAVDELCGFIIAVALVRPNKKLSEVTVDSVNKKLKDKGFARQVNRNDIFLGIKEINISLDDHINNCLKALKSISNELGL